MKKTITFLFAFFVIYVWQLSAQITSFPYTEDFESGSLPTGWLKELPGGSSSNDITVSTSQNHTSGGQYSVRFSSWNTSSDYNQYLFTDTIHVTSPYTVMTFWVRKYNSSSEQLQWGISTGTQSSGDVSNWTDITLTTSWEKVTVDLSAYAGQSIFFAWHYYGNYLYYVYLDDVKIDEPPACPEPSDLDVTNITTDQADLSWTENGSATTWNIEYGPIGFTQGSGTTISVTSNPYTLTGLSEATAYDFYVQADCAASGGTGTSNWVGPYTFVTHPVNDDCDNAISLTVNSDNSCTNVTHGTNVGATASSQADDVTGTPDNDVWYSFVATNTSHNISLLNVTAVVGSYTDMGMGLYDGSGGCNSLTLVADSDPNTFRADGLTVGTTYYLRVYGWSTGSYDAQTEYDVCIGTPPPPPVNDNCSGAITLTVGQTCTNEVADNSSATDSGVPDPSCSSYNGGDLWYTFTAPNTTDGQVIVETSSVSGSSVTDTGLAVYTGDCSNLSEVACDDDSGSGAFSQITLSSVTAGTVYYVRVFEYGNNSFGEFNVCAYAPNLSAQTLTAAEFSFYPNPTSNMISWKANGSVEKVQITNLTGQVVMDVNNPATNSLNIAKLNQGVYLLHVIVDGKEGTYKLIKE